ncbi:MAG: flagellar basal body rod protein FlgF [Acetobacteraceae bacterium]|jgi:flagellar basal-body rod protein FlgF|nr:flagellar basal body rod protein FlgF [Acetobacteraceae bacterium]
MSQQLFYLAMAGLDATMDRVTAAANNLANRGTTAFKAQKPVFEALPVYGQGLPDRVIATAAEENADLGSGAIEQTGRELDVAVKGAGWIIVQASGGEPVLSRNGALAISPGGLVQNSEGHLVLGRGFAPIVLPPLQSVTIGEDGTISGALVGQSPDEVTALNRIMLANPPASSLRRRPDGLFEDPTAAPQPDAGVRLQVGALEESNAETVSMMMNMIENTRMFQMQTELIRMALAAGQGQSSPLTLS